MHPGVEDFFAESWCLCPKLDKIRTTIGKKHQLGCAIPVIDGTGGAKDNRRLALVFFSNVTLCYLLAQCQLFSVVSSTDTI